MHSLGKLSTASNLEVSQIECHPELPQVVASTSGNNVLVWDLQSPEQQKTTLNGFKQITSISWRQAQDQILASASQDNNLTLWDAKMSTAIKRV